MHSYTATTMLSVCVILLALASHKTMAEDGVPTAPVRPEGGFSSSEDLKQYLTELRRYYAVVSRPRFGKRSENSIPAAVESRNTISAEDSHNSKPQEQPVMRNIPSNTRSLWYIIESLARKQESTYSNRWMQNAH